MLSRLLLTLWITAAAVGLGLAPIAAQEEAAQGEAAPEETAQQRPAPYGSWLTQDEGSKVEIFDCGEAMCGRVTWLLEEHDKDGNLLTDVYNPNPALRSAPILGLIIMYDIVPTDEEGVWQGKVYNPQDGRTYEFWLTVKSESQIIIEGCGLYGLICQKHKWARTDS